LLLVVAGIPSEMKGNVAGHQPSAEAGHAHGRLWLLCYWWEWLCSYEDPLV
jgi:hypothetical protein